MPAYYKTLTHLDIIIVSWSPSFFLRTQLPWPFPGSQEFTPGLALLCPCGRNQSEFSNTGKQQVCPSSEKHCDSGSGISLWGQSPPCYSARALDRAWSCSMAVSLIATQGWWSGRVMGRISLSLPHKMAASRWARNFHVCHSHHHILIEYTSYLHIPGTWKNMLTKWANFRCFPTGGKSVTVHSGGDRARLLGSVIRETEAS